MNGAGDGPQRRYVRPSDRRLAEVAAQAAAQIDLNTLQYRRSVAAGVTTERSRDGAVVTATSVIECSLAEMRGLLAAPTNDHYACVMRELVGQDFIYGSIVHHAEEIKTYNVTVRTATFLKRHMLARNEQWCYVSAVKTLQALGNNDVDGFTIELASLDPDDVFNGKAQAASVINIRGLSILFLVTAEPGRIMKGGRTKRAVRVTFCAHVATIGSSRPSRFRWLNLARNREKADDASNGAVLSRVVQLAQVPKQLPVAVRRRRLDAQVLADLRKVQPSNSRCACCTRRVGVMRTIFSASKGKSSSRGSKRCQLCGFLVCARCVCTVGTGSMSSETSEPSTTGVKHSQAVHLCEHCMQRVDDADYDSYCASNNSLSPLAIQPDSPDTEPVSAAIARALCQTLGNASQEEKPVVIRVIKHLLSPKQEREPSKFRADSVELAKSLTHLAKKQGLSKEIPKPKTKQGPKVMSYGSSSPEDKSVPPVAGTSGRQYVLQYADLCEDNAAEDAEDTEDTEGAEDTEEFKNGDVVSNLARHPVPTDEAHRLQWVDKHRNIVSCIMGLPELHLLCDLARGALKCDDALVSIIGHNAVHVVASTNPAWQGSRIPRDQSMCCHAIMTGAPLLVRFPEADIRFHSMDIVRSGIRFYFGFPVMIMYGDGGRSFAVGTFCCVNAGTTREVSESQYAFVATLAEGVARVMEKFAEELDESC
ncbi:unnamed protein product [Peronospora farinosa]|uniref:GAF domain-containing protein n=1 Tax=Peronospora farinosa TaxID=134698 RepID=A0AAV0TY76_9STRA|nr:unnamed protein product [Peronospora farinosa]